MKKLVKSMMMLSIASIAILSSCSKTDDNAEVTDVKVDITSSPANPVLIGAPITFTITATGNVDNKLKAISVTRADGKVILSQSLSGTTQTLPAYDTIATVGSYDYTVAVTGEKGSPATKVYTVVTRAPYGAIDATPVAIDLFGQTQDSSQSYFMQLTHPFAPFDRGRQTFADNKAKIDMGFYYGNTNQATLASPDDALLQSVYTYITWTGAKKTKFAKTTVTAAQFEALAATASTTGNDSAIVAIAAGTTTWGGSVNKLAKDNVLVFQTAEGKQGLVLVSGLTGTQASSAKISVKVIAQH